MYNDLCNSLSSLISDSDDAKRSGLDEMVEGREGWLRVNDPLE
jgi:hypothetical protein